MEINIFALWVVNPSLAPTNYQDGLLWNPLTSMQSFILRTLYNPTAPGDVLEADTEASTSAAEAADVWDNFDCLEFGPAPADFNDDISTVGKETCHLKWS